MITVQEAKTKFDNTIVHFEEDLKVLRAGRPSPEMFTSVQVEAYGAMSKLEGVASINVVDATLVTIQPWDKSLLSAVEKGIQKADLGFNPQVDGDMIRIPIPLLTKDKREEMVKKVKELSETHKIQVRVARKEAHTLIDKQKKDGDVSEDDASASEKDLQTAVDATNKKIDEITADKEKALMTI